MKTREVELGVALVAAPLIILTYNLTLYHHFSNILFLNIEAKSLLNVLVIYPILEELIFRGIIQELLSLKLKRRFLFDRVSLSNLLTSFIFVGIHFVHHPPVWAMLVLFPSLVFGYFKERYKTILVPTALHIFYNMCFLFIIL